MKRDVTDSGPRIRLLIAIQQSVVENAMGSSKFPLLYSLPHAGHFSGKQD